MSRDPAGAGANMEALLVQAADALAAFIDGTISDSERADAAELVAEIRALDEDPIRDAESAGAEFFTGLGEWRAGQGAIVTDWCPTKAKAAKEYLRRVAEEAWLKEARPAIEQERELLARHGDPLARFKPGYKG